MRSKWIDKLREINPRSIVYLFSGGKDSSLALLLTRDVVKEFSRETGARVYIAYVLIPGNTHPLNTFCASSIMLHHRSYGFQPVWLSSSRVFQEYVPRYGLQIGSQRWCYTQFKWKPIEKFLRSLERPVLTIDGMSPRDSRKRARTITSEFTSVVSSSGLRWWSWHPLYGIDMPSDEKLEVLSRYREFSCVVELYRRFGDSLNCVICPYRPGIRLEKDMKWIVVDFLERSVRSERIRKRIVGEG